MRITIRDIQKMTADKVAIPMITAYDYTSAQIVDRAGIPMILVGDSMGMVVHGHSSTLPVTLDDIVRHAAAVVRGSTKALIVADLPFLTYATPEQAVGAAQRLMQQAGVQAVKLEGGAPIIPAVRRLTELGVPVMGHLGYTPQSENQIGIRVQGKQADDARQLIEDALALQAAGAFAVVLELVPAELAAAITDRLEIPTIGIGAGVGCAGQVQVWHDLLGLYGDKSPRHARRYAEIGSAIEAALKEYAGDVASHAFPTAANSAKMEPDALAQALADVKG
ncbi:MAG: 3-methyl-2-oxobutanoate hydroxymethyltransferase [Alphaproteobacteria bacterium]|nr:3-methyl-2-oxobutanoate hydroxymethyltransferase [Alphaproteobacteria bacterium]MBU0796270.1 3-methyl-2-oxobutanoate hydroxymethyltransferase [Alphaproteobacteria bacterium]MBU0887481.1 3-methyl-2-oxobutanoate hydroxymethyltransferase [Alphaproteobacteria bacterium]MBU1813310.1 3-methyl-2-oxobutanoate hydroxymethyltransferase [Alphaproteobacteria bacterium]MBU2089272.1 3-methyl-2-oxobutanoate hydroxymethyltransferase [Alphaproteobacteria bacterium]